MPITFAHRLVVVLVTLSTVTALGLRLQRPPDRPRVNEPSRRPATDPTADPGYHVLAAEGTMLTLVKPTPEAAPSLVACALILAAGAKESAAAGPADYDKVLRECHFRFVFDRRPTVPVGPNREPAEVDALVIGFRPARGVARCGKVFYTFDRLPYPAQVRFQGLLTEVRSPLERPANRD